ncbi:MAG: hypothetical protein WBB67_12165 [bacterium]
MKRTLSKRQSAALEVMSKPKTFTELREQIGLKTTSNISSTLNELINLNLIYCITPRVKVGKLYGLTNKGIRYRKTILGKKGLIYQYTHPSDVNWKLYSWVICGRQRKAILKGLSTAMPLKYIKERAQQYNPKISRMNCHDILELFVKKGIARKIQYKNRVNFVLTKKGKKIRNQLLEL